MIGRFLKRMKSSASRPNVAGGKNARRDDTREILERIRNGDVEIARPYTKQGGHVRLRGTSGPLQREFTSSHESKRRFVAV